MTAETCLETGMCEVWIYFWKSKSRPNVGRQWWRCVYLIMKVLPVIWLIDLIKLCFFSVRADLSKTTTITPVALQGWSPNFYGSLWPTVTGTHEVQPSTRLFTTWQKFLLMTYWFQQIADPVEITSINLKIFNPIQQCTKTHSSSSPLRLGISLAQSLPKVPI